MRWAAYAGVSVTLAAGVVVKAMHQRSNFYAASVYLAQSTANLMILTNALLLAVGVFMLGLQRLFYGQLRPLEVEQLYERSWFAVTETCLALGIFRGEMGGWFLVMFLSLLAAKVWGWIGEGRVEVLEQQPPSNPRLFHTRLAASLAISILFSSFMLQYCINTVLHQARPDMMVMFGFEFALLTVQSLSTAARYIISLAEILVVRKQKRARLEERRAELRAERDNSSQDQAVEAPADPEIDEAELDVPGWEAKGRYVFYLDLITDFQKLVLYIVFFWILLMFYGLPIHIIRDVLLTFRSFFKRINDFRRYKNATRDMDARYPDATAEEVAREDVCIICREEMRPFRPEGAETSEENQNNNRPLANSLSERMRPKRLPCGHILHFSCLRSWLERQQICPTCRRPVVVTQQIHVGTAANAQQGQGAGLAPGGTDVNRNQRQGQDPNQARVFQFGPLRIVFGRGRGNLLGDLANQVNHGGLAQPVQPPAQDGAQQIGFGLGFGRQPTTEPTDAARLRARDVQLQLRQIENQITQEINSLSASAQQLSVIRALQNELLRVQQLQATPSAPHGGNAAILPSASNAFAPHLNPTQTLVQDGQHQVLTAGSDQLPPGLTLPEGWTMMPLQRVGPPPQQGVLINNTFPFGPSSMQQVSVVRQPSSGESAHQTPQTASAGTSNQNTSTVLPTAQPAGMVASQHNPSFAIPTQQPSTVDVAQQNLSNVPPAAQSTSMDASQPNSSMILPTPLQENETLLTGNSAGTQQTQPSLSSGSSTLNPSNARPPVGSSEQQTERTESPASPNIASLPSQDQPLPVWGSQGEGNDQGSERQGNGFVHDGFNSLIESNNVHTEGNPNSESTRSNRVGRNASVEDVADEEA
ncbi:MAG: hypothetical protein Q9227_005345 [Pyrenula ochraceoflavens]